MVLSIIHYGHKLLRTKCKEVEAITEEIRSLVASMIETMDAKHGIGIAAPQIGEDLRIFVARSYVEKQEGKSDVSDPCVYINPKIINKSEETCFETEGCLSIPGVREEVERPLAILIEATDLDGKRFQEELIGYNARIRMHENDHLNGVLFIDRIHPSRRKKITPFLKGLEKQLKK